MRLLRDIPKENLRGTRVLVRAGLDVPVEGDEVVDTFRIERALPTLLYLRECGARVIIISHIGRSPGETLAPVAKVLEQHIPLTFVSDTIGELARGAVSRMEAGDVLLLENLRRDGNDEEEQNDQFYAESLASLGEIYINDAFSVSHRGHASIVGIPKFLSSYAGFDLEDEVEHLSKGLIPPQTSVCILGGAKFETKAPLIEKLLSAYQYVFVCGALANDIFKAKGFEVGLSRVSTITPSSEVLQHPRLLTPVDVVVRRKSGEIATVLPEEVGPTDAIKDMGPQSLVLLSSHIQHADFVLWNGPTGLYEEGFIDETKKLAEEIGATGGFSIIGGGDTVATLSHEGLLKNFSFVSTGGGAMLEFLLNGTLPGIEALK